MTIASDSAPAPEPPSAGDVSAPGGRSSRAFWLAAWLALVAASGLLMFLYRHLAVLTEGGSDSFLKPLITEMTGALTAGLLFFPVRALVRRAPLRRGARLARLPLYAAAVLLFGVVATTSMWGMREVLWRLAGFGDYDYGIMPLRYLMEFPMQVILFSIMVGAIHAAEAFRRARERELHAAELEGSLARAQLRNLRLQLQPHFLFNALNTISATMYTDPAAADEMLDQLSGLLRASLRTARRDEVTLREELELLGHYLSILRARFGDRLSVTIEAGEELAPALVPSLLLQPLVENAVRHGGAERDGRGQVRIRAARRGARLRLEIEDDGPGCPPWRDPLRSGVGLSATADRLGLLYAGHHVFEAGSRPGGGFRVMMEIPFHTTRGAAA
ncbi:MAG TPA: histidine kinase [Candidatus Polarisedimenticolia bacterium]|nr:histidine kinase [Candidatus Polarisedimenticolia bacterium]